MPLISVFELKDEVVTLITLSVFNGKKRSSSTMNLKGIYSTLIRSVHTFTAFLIISVHTFIAFLIISVHTFTAFWLALFTHPKSEWGSF
jgi:hypothetical protein